MIRNLLLIGAGGFIGSVARYLVSKLNITVSLFAIPVGTLLVNIIGSFLIGLFIGISDKSTLLNTGWRMFLMVGLCGGFTTFSTFTGESLVLLHNGQYASLFVYTGLSLLLGFTAVFLGYASTNIL